MESARDGSSTDSDRSDRRHDLTIVLGAFTLIAIGIASGAFAAMHGWLEMRASGVTESAIGILLVSCTAGGAIAVHQRRRGRAERRRRTETEAKYQAMIEQVPAVAYSWDAADAPGSAPASYISPQIERLLGYTAEQWLDDPTLWGRLVHPDDLGRVLETWDDAVARRDRFVAEYRIATASGATLWVRDEATPATVDGGTWYRGVIHDVTLEHEARQRLAAAEERFRMLVEQLPAVIYVDAVDELVTARYVSPGYQELTGFTQAERMADPGLWMRIIHPDDRDRVIAESNRTNETGEDYDLEHRIVHRDGHVVWVHDHAVLVRDAHGETAWQGVLTDITDRKRAEASLERRDRILEAAGHAAERFLRQADWRECIDDVLERLGVAGAATRAGVYEHDELSTGLRTVLRHAWLDDGAAEALRRPSIPHPEGEAYARWVEVLGSGGVIHGPVAELPEGERGPIEASGIRSIVIVPIHVDGVWWGHIGLDDAREARVWHPAEIDAIRVAASTLGAAIEREMGARRLTEAESRYRAIVEHVPAAIYLDRADRSMHSIYVSPQIEEITGYTPREWLDEPELWLTIMVPDDRAETERTYLESVTAHEPWKADYRVNTRDGRTIWIHDETTFVTDADGTPLFLQGVLMDITERKLAEQALRDSERREREAAERLRALDEMKNTFLAAVSHELRSPLTSILGLALTLERSPALDEGDRGDLVERLALNARKLDRLLKDLLDIDRLNRGIVEPQLRSVDVATLTRRCVETLDALEGRTVTFEMVEPLAITVDPPKLERIVENLVANAARHTPDDRKIWIRWETVDDGAILSVEDDGPGIDPSLREAVFEPFRQGPTASPHAPGTGVGLSLVARFAELHGGRAWVDERQGGGSAFRVFLPATPLPGSPRLASIGAPAPTVVAEAG